MNRNILPLFSSPIYEAELEISDNENNSILNFVRSINYRKCIDSLNLSDGFISEEQNILNLPQLKKLKKLIETELNLFLYDGLSIDKNQKLKHLCSWSVKHKYGDKSHIHMHTNSMFSGVYYLKVPENSGNILTFHSQRLKMVVPTFAEYTQLNSTIWKLDIYDKKLVLFPSDVYHSVPVSESNEDRYSISFNYFLTGKFGKPTGYAFF